MTKSNFGAFLRASQISYQPPSRPDALFHDLSFSISHSRSGLMGVNGAGKSTLLRILAGELPPSSGSVETRGDIFFLPQQSALSYEALSGGEKAQQRLKALYESHADLVLLDEPTLHLDRGHRLRLLRWIDSFRGGLFVASHDRELLERVDQTLYLEHGSLRVYGGGFSFFDQCRKAETAARELKLHSAEQTQKKAIDQKRRVVEKQQKRSARAESRAPSQGLPKILLGARKRQAQRSLAKLQATHDARVSNARAHREALVEEIGPRIVARFAVPALAELPHSKRILELKDFRFKASAAQSRWLGPPQGLSGLFLGPTRLAIRGPNGSGKSTLLRAIQLCAQGETLPRELYSGTLYASPLRTQMLKQDLLDRLDLNQHALDFCIPSHEKSRESLLRAHLRHLGFDARKLERPLSTLSGGELTRAALFRILSASSPPQLLLLDEATNSLDFESVEALEEMLVEYKGALIAVSHDEKFLSALGVGAEIRLDEDQRLEIEG